MFLEQVCPIHLTCGSKPEYWMSYLHSTVSGPQFDSIFLDYLGVHVTWIWCPEEFPIGRLGLGWKLITNSTAERFWKIFPESRNSVQTFAASQDRRPKSRQKHSERLGPGNRNLVETSRMGSAPKFRNRNLLLSCRVLVYTTLYYIMLCYIILYYIILYYILLCYVMLHIISCYSISYYIILYCIILYHNYIMLYSIILHSILL